LALKSDVITNACIDLPPTEEEQLFRAVMRDRVANRLDNQITVTDLIRRYQSSRATVLRVLTRMSADGLIERGWGQSRVFGPALDSHSAGEESYSFRLQIVAGRHHGPGISG